MTLVNCTVHSERVGATVKGINICLKHYNSLHSLPYVLCYIHLKE